MGIVTKTTTEYVCDGCHKPMLAPFPGKMVIDLGGMPDQECSVEVSAKHVRHWAGEQVICNGCAALFLRFAADLIERTSAGKGEAK